MSRRFILTGLLCLAVLATSGRLRAPALAAEDGLAAHLYFKMPFGADAAPLDGARLGFRLEQDYQPDVFEFGGSLEDTDLALPLFNLEVSTQGLVQMNIFGLDGLPALEFVLPDQFGKSSLSQTEIDTLAGRLITNDAPAGASSLSDSAKSGE